MRAERSPFGNDPASKAYFAVAFDVPELAKGVDPAIIREEARAVADMRAATAKANHRSIAWIDTLTLPMLGAAGVIACTNSWQLGLIGAVGGLVAAFVRARESRGDLRIVSNDGVRTEHFYGSPRAYAKSAAEIDAELKAHGFLSDTIPPVSAETFTGASEAASPRLVKLANARRIVADVGVTSQYGKRVLSVVTPLQASELEARGVKLFIVDVQTPRAATERVHTVGSSPRTGWVDEHGSARELAIDYTLRPFDMADTSVHEGVPPYMNGVYADGSTVSAVLQRDNRSDGTYVRRFDGGIAKDTWASRAEASTTV